MAESDRSKEIKKTEVDKDEDILTRAVRTGVKGLAYGASRIADVAGSAAGAAAKYIKKEPEDQQDSSQREAEAEKKRESRGVRKTFEGMKKGGVVSSASKRADGCATKGKTKGRMI